MIRGVGLDLCGISRMEEAITHPRFLARIFSEEEQAYIQSKGKNGAQTAAGLFAAKEALLKAAGCGIQDLSLCQISITHDDMGMPLYRLNEKVQSLLSRRGAVSASLSVTHEGDMAAAVCILEG